MVKNTYVNSSQNLFHLNFFFLKKKKKKKKHLKTPLLSVQKRRKLQIETTKKPNLEGFLVSQIYKQTNTKQLVFGVDQIFFARKKMK